MGRDTRMDTRSAHRTPTRLLDRWRAEPHARIARYFSNVPFVQTRNPVQKGGILPVMLITRDPLKWHYTPAVDSVDHLQPNGRFSLKDDLIGNATAPS